MSQTNRCMLKTRLARPILVLARAMPMVRMNRPIGPFCRTKTATAAPKGLLIVRDELAGWIAGMNAYHGGGRSFWIEAYGGRPYRVERKSHPDPVIVPRLAVAV